MTVYEKARALGLCQPESGLKYEVKHPELYIKGICGIDTLWEEELKANNIPINSLRAGLYVYKKYKEGLRLGTYGAIKKYKGISSTKYLHRIATVEDLKNSYLSILKENNVK